jgi:hypothetical protein
LGLRRENLLVDEGISEDFEERLMEVERKNIEYENEL